MEIREFAERIFQGDTLEDKLFVPDGGFRALTDHEPGGPVTWRTPGRSGNFQVSNDVRHKRLPRPGALHDANMRIRCLHTFANHELMALEMMAWALLAFPDAPRSFRRGLLKILVDEQRHFQLYSERIERLGASFGDLPLNDHFWRVAHTLNSPLKWVCGMHLSFEQANLDHAPYFAELFQKVGDEDSAALMDIIFHDEIMHVRFGGHWLEQYKDEGRSSFDVFNESLGLAHPAHRARGLHFNAEARRAAGLSEEYIEAIAHCHRSLDHKRREPTPQEPRATPRDGTPDVSDAPAPQPSHREA